MDSKSRAFSQSLPEPRSGLKASEGQKRGMADVDETSENYMKRVKLRDLDSVFRSESQARREGDVHLKPLDLNVDVNDGTAECVGESAKHGFSKPIGLDLDLNTEDNSSSINDPFYPYKTCENLKSRDDSECASSVGPVDARDSMRVWKGLKQNNFMSAPHGTLPAPIPKPRGRKRNNNNDVMKKRIELARKDHVDRFAMLAAPSGLLNGLNPGIINHVRNSKQVHAIIEALVKSERDENHNFANKPMSSREINHRKETEACNLRGKGQMSDCDIFSKPSNLKADVFTRGNGDSYLKERIFPGMPMQHLLDSVNDKFALKLVPSENVSCLSNEEPDNLSSANSLSLKAANVASQWLELLSQDAKGRLTALRRSKRRVQSVISTELPVLVSREFPADFDKATVDAHSSKWGTLFGQMDTALSDEENHLENWLNQVKEMQSHCERGIFKNSLHHPAHLIAPLANNNRSGEVDKAENDLALKAAAASIYATCNFLLSMENQPCC